MTGVRTYRIFYIILLSLFLFSGKISAQWYEQTTPTKNSLHAVHFADPSNGWAVGAGIILHTVNGGSTWTIQNSEYTNSLFEKVFAINKNLCWIVGGDTLALKTTNGGESWQRQQLSVPFDTDWVPQAVYFTDSLTGWISGYYYYSTFDSEFVLHTTDGGNTWEKQYYSYYCYGYRVDAVDNTHAWIVCGNARLLRTTDGRSWNLVSTDKGNAYIDVDFVTPKIGWMLADGTVGEKYVRKSVDGGITWILQKWFSCSAINIFESFPDSLHGWIVRKDCFTGGVKIWNTTNGGNGWNMQLETYPLFPIIQRNIFFLDTLNGWMVGDSGMVWNTANGGITDVAEHQNVFQNEFTLKQNYPNPFNPSTTISYELHKNSFVQLKVYDILGRELTTLVNEYQEAGLRTVSFEGANFPSGIYFYRITVGRSTNVRKMLLMK